MAAHRMIGIRGMADLSMSARQRHRQVERSARREPIPRYFNGLARLAGPNRAVELWVAAGTSGRKIARANPRAGGARRRRALG